MMRTAFFCTAVAAFALSGCAAHTGGAASVAISATDYSSLSCETSRTELTEARARKGDLTRRESHAALVDVNGVSRSTVWRGSAFGAELEGKLAQAKVEVETLERSIQARCNG
ncbi:hypothetical protein [Brevundimonas mediterranea]|uniref:Lipoprotein n=1 Tax=Brevundimonas mediterranea TaxID=74329 RepID=A0A7W6A5N0_9CAUL|nr:hypothetical protein [Brevundimonas mediterranea]MBB3872612.1 hypothetical protein [Brevundimonas mediterranea]